MAAKRIKLDDQASGSGAMSEADTVPGDPQAQSMTSTDPFNEVAAGADSQPIFGNDSQVIQQPSGPVIEAPVVIVETQVIVVHVPITYRRSFSRENGRQILVPQVHTVQKIIEVPEEIIEVPEKNEEPLLPGVYPHFPNPIETMSDDEDDDDDSDDDMVYPTEPPLFVDPFAAAVQGQRSPLLQ